MSLITKQEEEKIIEKYKIVVETQGVKIGSQKEIKIQLHFFQGVIIGLDAIGVETPASWLICLMCGRSILKECYSGKQ